MRSKPRLRSKTSGFSLLEALIAMSLLSFVLGITYTVALRSIQQQNSARVNYELLAMARAVLDEYVATYPTTPMSGSYKGTWVWRITETKIDPVLESEFNRFYQFVDIEIEVSRDGLNETSQSLSQVVSRRAQNP